MYVCSCVDYSKTHRKYVMQRIYPSHKCPLNIAPHSVNQIPFEYRVKHIREYHSAPPLHFTNNLYIYIVFAFFIAHQYYLVTMNWIDIRIWHKNNVALCIYQILTISSHLKKLRMNAHTWSQPFSPTNNIEIGLPRLRFSSLISMDL